MAKKIQHEVSESYHMAPGPEINGYSLINGEKYDRVINGSMGRNNEMINALGVDASPEDVIAHYDKLGGLIRKGKHTVKMGSFWDFKKRAPHATPKPVLVFRDLMGETVEIAVGEEIPIEVQAAQMAADNRNERNVKALAKKKAASADAKKKKKDAGDEEESEDDEDSEDEE